MNHKTNSLFILLLSIICSMVLVGCKDASIKKVEEKIKAIGTVSIDSQGDIELAKKAYDSLTIEQQKEVENYSDLEKATVDYAVLLIDNINIDDTNSISKAREFYDGIPENGKTKVTNYQMLVEAEKAEKVIIFRNDLEALIKKNGKIEENSDGTEADVLYFIEDGSGRYMYLIYYPENKNMGYDELYLCDLATSEYGYIVQMIHFNLDDDQMIVEVKGQMGLNTVDYSASISRSEYTKGKRGYSWDKKEQSSGVGGTGDLDVVLDNMDANMEMCCDKLSVYSGNTITPQDFGFINW